MLLIKKFNNKIIPGFNIFGMDDTLAIMKACKEKRVPVFLMTNKDSIKRIGINFWASFLKEVKASYETDIYIHLDHSTDLDLIKKAIALGYDSVMYDGSQLSLEENIRNTKEVVDYAQQFNCLVEGEIGAVRYANIDESIYRHQLTRPGEVKLFAKTTGVDLIAISIGTVHKLLNKKSEINYTLLEEIQSVTERPLVLHGFSSVSEGDIIKLRKTNVTKVNIGTYLRQAYGMTLRKNVQKSNAFDRYKLTKESVDQVYRQTKIKLKQLGW